MAVQLWADPAKKMKSKMLSYLLLQPVPVLGQLLSKMQAGSTHLIVPFDMNKSNAVLPFLVEGDTSKL